MIHLSKHITEYFKTHFYSLHHLSRGLAAGRRFLLCVCDCWKLFWSQALVFKGTVNLVYTGLNICRQLSVTLCVISRMQSGLLVMGAVSSALQTPLLWGWMSFRYRCWTKPFHSLCKVK